MGAGFSLYGIPIPAEDARDADDGTTVFDADDQPVTRHRINPTRRCRCSHAKSQHTRGAGQCWSTVCGCGSFREQAPA